MKKCGWCGEYYSGQDYEASFEATGITMGKSRWDFCSNRCAQEWKNSALREQAEHNRGWENKLQAAKAEREAWGGRETAEDLYYQGDWRAALSIKNSPIGNLGVHLEADCLRLDGRFDEAIDILEKQYNTNDQRANMHAEQQVTLAAAYLGKDKWDKAVKECNTAIEKIEKIYGNNADSWEYAWAKAVRGAAYLGKSKQDLAVQDLGEVVRLQPTYQPAKDLLAKAQNWDTSAASSLATTVSPGYVQSVSYRGLTAASNDDYAKAFKLYSAAAALGNVDAQCKLGDLYTNGTGVAQNYAKAVELYSKAIRLDPNHTNPGGISIYAGRALAYALKGDYDLALKDANTAAQTNPNSDDVLYARGFAYMGKRDYDRAIADFEAALRVYENSNFIGPNDDKIRQYLEEAQQAKAKAAKAVAQVKPVTAPVTAAQAVTTASTTTKKAPAPAAAATTTKKESPVKKTTETPAPAAPATIKCPSCGKTVPVGKFCPECGAVTEETCRSCGAVMPTGAKFCLQCGKSTMSPEKEAYDKAQRYYKNGDWNNAIKAFTEAIDLGFLPTKTDNAYYFRGYAYFQKNQYDQAINDFTEALNIDPNDTVTLGYRGGAYLQKGDKQQAIADLEKCLSIKPQDTTVERMLWRAKGNAFEKGVEYFNAGDWDKAIDALTVAIEQGCADMGKAYQYRGRAYRIKIQFDKAIKDYTESLAIDPKNAIALRGRGEMYTIEKQYDKAISDLTEALIIEPNNFCALRDRAASYFNTNQYDQAITDYTGIIDIEPNEAFGFRRRGETYLKKGDKEKAIADLEKALSSNHRAEYEKEITKRMLLQAKGNAFEKGVEYFNAGDWDNAIEVLTVAIDQGGSDKAKAYLYRGKAYCRRNNYTAAIKDFTGALEIDPNNADTLCARGQAYYQSSSEKNHWDNAIKDFTDALKIDPNNTDALCGRGQAYLLIKLYHYGTSNVKRFEKFCNNAIKDFTGVLKIDPNNASAKHGKAEAKARKRSLLWHGFWSIGVFGGWHIWFGIMAAISLLVCSIIKSVKYGLPFLAGLGVCIAAPAIGFCLTNVAWRRNKVVFAAIVIGLWAVWWL